MKTIASILAGAALILSGTQAFARSGPSGEERLARMLAGRVAGQPMRCISEFSRGRDVQVIDRVGVVYDAGDTVWVARAIDPESLRDRDILIIERMGGGSLCRDDVKRTVDRTAGMLKSVVFLSDFVPYRRG